MSTRLEVMKSIVLILLVAGSLVLTVALWALSPPLSSLPPELAGGPDREPGQVRRTFDVYTPIAAILHDGSRGHIAIGPGDALDELSEALGTLLGFAGSENLRSVDLEDGQLSDGLLREQAEVGGASVFLAGGIPLGMLLESLGADAVDADAAVDRLLVQVRESEEIVSVHFGGDDGWYVAHWDLIPGLGEASADDGFPVPGANGFGGEAAAAWELANVLGREFDEGRSMILLSAWREMAVRPLVGIPEMDLRVRVSTSRPVAFVPSAFFPDFERARSYPDADGSRTHTDGFRSLNVDPGGGVRYTYVPDEDSEDQRQAPGPADALQDAKRFLGNVMPAGSEDLVLAGVEAIPERGTFDLEAGGIDVAGYRFRFAQAYGGSQVVDPDNPLEIEVDAFGVRSAILWSWTPGRTVQETRGITPLSALENAVDHLVEVGLDAGNYVRRIDLVDYPAEAIGEQRVMRPAWVLRLAEESVLVDATSGEVVAVLR